MSASDQRADVVLVGTGFASTFFLHRWLKSAPPKARVVVFERGQQRTTAWRLERKYHLFDLARKSYDNETPDKEWVFTMALGGSSNCWWACTPRFLPEDFELHTRYGVGVDWPIGYDDLEAYYVEAERLMAVGGGRVPWAMSAPYPSPPHRMCTPGKRLAAAAPEHWFPQPTARASSPQPGRKVCCNNGVCHLCPIDAKFTISGAMASPYRDPRVELRTGAEVLSVDTGAGQATGVAWRRVGEEAVHHTRADLVGLGANALFNGHLLVRSGLTEGGAGTRLHEQAGVYVVADLSGVEGFDGGTSISALGYPLYAGAHRRTRAAAHIEVRNSPPHLRDLPGRWRERLVLKVVFEDHPSEASRVVPSASDPSRPRVRWAGRSPQTQAGLDQVTTLLDEVLKPLPVEGLDVLEIDPTEAHIIGTARMGRSPQSSVVDASLRHHRLRNLLVLGSSAFPSAPPANPTLTLCATVLRAADKLGAP